MRYLLAAVPLLLAAGSPTLTIGGEAFSQDEIVDARASVDAAARPAVVITFTPKAAKRLQLLAAAKQGETLPITVDGALVAGPMIRGEIAETIVIEGIEHLDSAVDLARRISGKAPLPEDLEE